MKLQDLFNDRGVSPVIGVVLMVAITVILAATVGVLLIQFGENTVPSDTDRVTPPSATFNIDTMDTDSDAGADKIVITHQTTSNGPIKAGDVYISGLPIDTSAGTVDDTTFAGVNNGDSIGSSDNLEPTDTVTLQSGTELSSDFSGEFSIIWQSPNGDSSTTLQTVEV